ncbi:hypothetical protein Aab01nite_46440 [Paractinoplanes abujensis]|uniref:PknH-like extracellular domain-containing protein n=1 Tax=Paractinoplanes abujensis TaxID=882441 RepID=A0A7W7CNZ0_9ACTN|nr:hypothetical protein [Actinoplanes abujensis]MBB4690291.1 hypothetical protein [Actinoplanes abujensis]GID21054.1 hypothetical protein Aab01nite_46440 [Actinoplanes abujensis]
MPNAEVDDAFAALSSDAERGLLLSGPELRRQAGRRHNRGIALTTGTAAVLAVAAIGAGWALAGDNQQKSALPPAASAGPTVSSAAPSTAPSVVPPPVTSAPATTKPPSSPPTSNAPAIPKSIPARALISPDDKGVSDFHRYDEPEPRPEFCGKAKFPSQDDVGVSASVRMFYRGPGTPADYIADDTLFNTVTVYRGEGAEDFMSELARAVQNCPTGKLGDLEAEFDSLGSLGLGDSSILIDRSYASTGDDGEPSNNGSRQHTFIAAVRVGDAVTLIDTRGYESASSQRKNVEAMAKIATNRLAEWR